MAEQADALRSGRSGIYSHVGSTPTFGTNRYWTDLITFGSVFALVVLGITILIKLGGEDKIYLEPDKTGISRAIDWSF